MTKTDMVNWPSCGRLLRSLGGKSVIMILLVAAGLGVTWLDSRAIRRPGQSMERIDPPGTGINIRTEVTHLWLPETLIELAREQVEPEAMPVQTYDELQVVLERGERQDVWYAITLRSHQADGHVAEITYIRKPYHESENFREVPHILARAARVPSPDGASPFSEAEIHILSRAQTQREPREVMEQLVGSPARRPEFVRGSR